VRPTAAAAAGSTSPTPPTSRSRKLTSAGSRGSYGLGGHHPRARRRAGRVRENRRTRRLLALDGAPEASGGGDRPTPRGRPHRPPRARPRRSSLRLATSGSLVGLSGSGSARPFGSALRRPRARLGPGQAPPRPALWTSRRRSHASSDHQPPLQRRTRSNLHRATARGREVAFSIVVNPMSSSRIATAKLDMATAARRI
jgi:hypothetical protein